MKIYRKRYIPNEIVDISGDELLYQDAEMIVTKWKPIHPKKGIAWGMSYTLLNKGWKISKFYNFEDELCYWYCDIIEADYDSEKDILTTTDLLVDLKIYPDGTHEVLDVEELDEAIEEKLITEEQKQDALNKLNELLKIVEEKKFPPMRELGDVH